MDREMMRILVTPLDPSSLAEDPDPQAVLIAGGDHAGP
jgi:hypothetical protein